MNLKRLMEVGKRVRRAEKDGEKRGNLDEKRKPVAEEKKGKHEKRDVKYR